MQELFERYDLTYVTGPLPKQVASAWRKVFRLALPDRISPSTLTTLVRRPAAGRAGTADEQSSAA